MEPRPARFWRRHFVGTALPAAVGWLLTSCGVCLLGRASADSLTCQLYTESGTSLQDLMQVECIITDNSCNCSSATLLGMGVDPTWSVITGRMNDTMAKNSTPGFWYLTDQEGKCGASFSGKPVPDVLSCPAAFFCEGGLHNPKTCADGDHCVGGTTMYNRRCPAGYFCPFPAAPKMKCMDGAVCNEGSKQPDSCDAGKYCRGGLQHECPSGHYCPLACVDPVKCTPWKLCPAGSTHEDSAPIALTFAVLGIVFMVVGAWFYEDFVRNPYRVCTVLGLTISLLWFVDSVVAGFMSLNFIAIASNILLYKFCKCPPVAAQGLLNATFLAAIIVLYRLNAAWAMLLAGLWMVFAVGWLMTRSKRSLRFLGRGLLVTLLVLLVFSYWRLDSSFLRYYATCVVGLAAYYVVTWLVNDILGFGAQGMPFKTRWQPVADGGDFHMEGEPPVLPYNDSRSPSVQSSTGHIMGIEGGFGNSCGKFEPLSSSLAESASSLGMGDASSVTATGNGVSFLLEGVNFCLRDGTVLLKDINLGILPGKRCAVMGPSGSGKSTLLAVLSGRGSYGVVTGSMCIGGHQARDPRFLRHVTGYVPQDDIIHGELTVIENVTFQAQLRLPATHSSEEVAQAVQQVLKDLHLENICKSRVGTPEHRGISGGQRKRVSIAMELVTEPLLLFADEPTSGLDSTTAHEVVGCMNQSAERLGTTVLCVIHQPRYETLLLFDELILLATGGTLVYSGPTDAAKHAFATYLDTRFPADANPADTLLDSIQGTESLPSGARLRSLQGYGESVPLCKRLKKTPTPKSLFSREVVPFFKAVIIFMDRAMLQTMRSYSSIVINQFLCLAVTYILTTIMPNVNVEKYFLQSNFVTLFLMLLQGVAAQRIFGTELLITLREAGVGVPSLAYVVAKDLATFFEITLSAAIFAASWGTLSGVQQPVAGIFGGAWAFIYSVYGIGYIFSICMSSGAAQMSMVVTAFISFVVSGVYQPLLPDMTRMLAGRGWMVPATSPVRWFWGYLLTMEMRYLTPLAKQYGHGTLEWRGYDLNFLEACSLDGVSPTYGVVSLRDAWLANRGWVCSSMDMILLGILFRFVAGVCLIFYIHAHTSKMAQFFGQSEKSPPPALALTTSHGDSGFASPLLTVAPPPGTSIRSLGAVRDATRQRARCALQMRGFKQLLGKLFTVFVMAFVMIFFFCEIWIFSVRQVDVKALFDYLHQPVTPSGLR